MSDTKHEADGRHVPSLELAARDFDAYAPEKATSNVYSRPRLELKQRALAWARGVVARLAELGIVVDVHASDEHPSLRNKKRVEQQWVFFSRDPEASAEIARLLDLGRSISDAIDDPDPSTRHAFLALEIDVKGLEVGFAVHPEAKVDLDNLKALLAEGDGADRFVAALRALPEQFSIGSSEVERTACTAATPDALRALLAQVSEGQVPLRIGWRVARDTATEHAAILGEQLEDALVALAPIYRLVAWSKDNDRVALDRKLEGAEQERARAHADLAAKDAKWRAEQAAAIDRSREAARARHEEELGLSPPPPFAAKRPTLATLFKPSKTERPKHDERSDGREDPDAAHRETRAHDDTARAHEPRAALEPARAPSGVIEKGARVRVLRGPFAEKLGVIGDLDGRGGARVLLGLLSTRLDLADLEHAPERQERPALQSSHRKPLAPAPRKAR